MRVSLPGHLQWVEISDPGGCYPSGEGEQDQEQVPIQEEEGDGEIGRLEGDEAAGEVLLCLQLYTSALWNSYTFSYEYQVRKAPLLGSELPSVTATGKEKKRKITDAGLSPPYWFPQGSGESNDSSRPPLPGGNIPQYDGEMLSKSLVSSSLSSSLDDTGLESSEIIISDGKLQLVMLSLLL